MRDINYEDWIGEYSKRWGQKDEKLAYFEVNFIEWINQFPVEEHLMILQLLSDFEYYSQMKVNGELTNLHVQLMTKFNLKDEETVYIYIPSKNGIANSSHEYWSEYRLKNKVNRFSCFEDIDKMSADKKAKTKNYVIVDDCCGSGTTILDFAQRMHEKLAGKNIYYLVIHAMADALNTIEIEKQKLECSLYVINTKMQEKAFNHERWKDNAACCREAILRISERFSVKPDYALGYKLSESLMAFYNNTPNNTIGIFWMSSEKYSAIFPRQEDPEDVSKKRFDYRKFGSDQSMRHAQNYIAKQEVAKNG